jgi:preprotein translocase subunit SecA
MFVDLMNDIYNTFSERFLKVQLVFEETPPAAPPPPPEARRPTRRYNAMGILEDIPSEELTKPTSPAPSGQPQGAVDVGPAETPAGPPASQEPPVTARKDPTIIGAGRPRTLGDNQPKGPVDWSTIGRNDPCPCGSGKKFKKCHGANL